MTNALGIAAVTAALREMLRNGLIDGHVNDILGVNVDVSTSPPDMVAQGIGAELTQLNLFLHRVSANPGWRNEGLPARGVSGRQRLSNPPLALDLHYLLTAYCADDLHAEVLLGVALQLLHERPVLSREMIRTLLAPSPPPGSPLERALLDSGLAEQIELVKITPVNLDTEEISKFWSATQSHLRPTAAYRATVVLIEADDPVHSSLPVLTRGKPITGTEHDEGIRVEADLEPPLPTLDAVEPVSKQVVVQLGEAVELRGHHLAGTGRTVIFANDRFAVEESLAAEPGNQADRVKFIIPASAADDFPVGVYSVGLQLVRPGETSQRESNRLGLTIAPTITGLPISVARDGAGTARFTLHFLPTLRQHQRVVLVLGQQEYEPQPYTVPAASLDFVIEDAPVQAGPGHLVRLRVDGIDSPIVDRAAKPPQFLNQRIVIT